MDKSFNNILKKPKQNLLKNLWFSCLIVDWILINIIILLIPIESVIPNEYLSAIIKNVVLYTILYFLYCTGHLCFF